MTEAIEIDSAKAITLLREVVKGKEEYVYKRPVGSSGPACVYQANGEPSCVVGKALFKVGVTADELDAMDRTGVHTGINSVTLPERVSLTNDARAVFAAAQEKQDRGTEWGIALRAAEECYLSLS